MTLSFDQIIKSIEQLPEPEQERIRRWLDEKGTSNGEGPGSQAHANRSAKSLRCLHENLEKYLGQWVARDRSEEHTSEFQSLAYLVCRLLLEKKKQMMS